MSSRRTVPHAHTDSSLSTFYNDSDNDEEKTIGGESPFDGSQVKGKLYPSYSHETVQVQRNKLNSTGSGRFPVRPNSDQTQSARTPTPVEPEKARLSGADSIAEAKLEKQASLPPQGPPLKPLEGKDAWLCVLGGFFCLFVSFGWVNCVGLFQAFYEQTYLRNYQSGQIAWITSLEIFLMFFLGIFFGKLFDSHGPRWLLIIGTFFHVFGLMMAALSTKYYQFVLSQGICSSIGASAIFYGAVGATSGWFVKHQALAVGLVASGSSVGGIVFPIMIKAILPKIGFPWSMRCAAFLILGLLVVANFTVKTRAPPAPKAGSPKILLLPFKDKLWCVTTAGAFLFSFGMFPVYNFLVSEAVNSGMSETLAIYCLVILNAAALPGRIIPNAISDRVGRYNTMVVCAGLSAIVVFAIWLPGRDSNAGIIAFSAAFGFASGAYVGLAPALMLQISQPQVVGLKIGMMYAMASFAALLSSPLGGNILDEWNQRYQGIMIYSGFMMVGGMIFFGIARVMQVGFAIKKV
ncbi:MAG: hypothetical protein Q9159_004302 [Coniocarpon cinnabarinum]